MIWKYEPVSSTVPLQYRILRVTERIEVHPSLEIKTELKLAFESEILLLKAKNLQEINSFKIAEFQIHEQHFHQSGQFYIHHEIIIRVTIRKYLQQCTP